MKLTLDRSVNLAMLLTCVGIGAVLLHIDRVATAPVALKRPQPFQKGDRIGRVTGSNARWS